MCAFGILELRQHAKLLLLGGHAEADAACVHALVELLYVGHAESQLDGTSGVGLRRHSCFVLHADWTGCISLPRLSRQKQQDRNALWRRENPPLPILGMG